MNTLSRQTKKTMAQQHRRLDGVQVHLAKGDVSGQTAMQKEDTEMVSCCRQPSEEEGRLEREREENLNICSSSSEALHPETPFTVVQGHQFRY